METDFSPLNPHNRFLMSLLASEPVVDSQDSKILAAEEVNKLKKVCIPTLSSLTFIDFVKGTSSSYFKTRSYVEKLSSGTTIQDAALSLSKVNVSHKKCLQTDTGARRRCKLQG